MSDTEKKKVSPEFVHSVKKYLEVDDKLKAIKKEFKEISKNLNNEKKNNEDFILNYLQTINENVIDVPDGKLRRNITKKQEPLKKDNIHKTLTEIIGDANKANDITDKIIKARPFVEKVTLKRTKNKVSNVDE